MIAVDETTPFYLENFPTRTVHTTFAFHPPWTQTSTTLLNSYNQQTWFLHDMGRDDAAWWTVWRLPNADREETTWMPKPIQDEARKTLDHITAVWNDLTISLWELVEPDRYWRISPTLGFHEYLLLILNDIDTRKDESLIICEHLPSWRAWIKNVPPTLTYLQALALFHNEDTVAMIFQGQLWHNGNLHMPEEGDFHLMHGDIISMSGGEISSMSTQKVKVQNETERRHDEDPVLSRPSSSTTTVRPRRTPTTGPFSAIVSGPEPPEHAFQVDHHVDPDTAITTFSFTENFTNSVRQLRGSAAPFPNRFGRRGEDVPEEDEEPPRRSDEDNRVLRSSVTAIGHGGAFLCVRYASRDHGDLYAHINFNPTGTPDEWIQAVEYAWPPLRFIAWRFLAIRDPIRDSTVIRPSADAVLIAVYNEERWPRVRVAFEVDKLDRSFRNRIVELTQEQVPTVVNRIQLIAFSDFADLCDPTRTARNYHCYVYVNGRPLQDEDMQAIREGFHILLRIIPREDLPAELFPVTRVSANGFDEQDFPRRVVQHSITQTAIPWSILPAHALQSYCTSLWTDHGGAVLTQRWFTAWRVRSPMYHRITSVRVRRAHPENAWVMVDRIHAQWPDLQPRPWSFMPVHGSYMLSTTLARHAQFVLISTPLDTPHNMALIVLNHEGVDAWASNLPRRVSLHQLTGAFGMVDFIPHTRFLRNGVPLQDPTVLYDANMGDVFTLINEEGSQPGSIENSLRINDPPQPPERNRAHPYARNTRRSTNPRGAASSASGFRPTDSIATVTALPTAANVTPLCTFQQLDAMPITNSFTDEFFLRWRDIMTTRNAGSPPLPQEAPQEAEEGEWSAFPTIRSQVLRSLRLGWNTIWRRHQRPGAPLAHPGDPFDHMEIDLVPALTVEDVFALIFAYWPDLRLENQWSLTQADESVSQARGTIPWRGQLLYLSSILDGRPGHQILGFELTYDEARHHLLTIPEEHLLLNGIPWERGDIIEVTDGDFLCARLLQQQDAEFGNDIALNFWISRAATTQDLNRLGRPVERTGPNGQDRPEHPLTPTSPGPEDSIIFTYARKVFNFRCRQGNKTVHFNDEPDSLYLFDEEGSYLVEWNPERLLLNPAPFELPPELHPEEEEPLDVESEKVVQVAGQAANTIDFLDMHCGIWSSWAWEHEPTDFLWSKNEEACSFSQEPAGTMPVAHIQDLHQCLTELPLETLVSTAIPRMSEDLWLHPNTCTAMPFVSSPLQGEAVRMLLYTDGSYQPAGLLSGGRSAAWSVVVLVQDADDVLHYWGHLAASCEAGSAYEAEVDAMIVAMIWAYHVTTAQRIEVHFCFDCTSADFVATFPSKATTKFPIAVLRGLSQALRQHAYVQSKHIPGHQGDPFNELANSFANQARLRQIACPTDLDNLLDLLSEDPVSVQWLWALHDPQAAGFEAGNDGQVWNVPRPQPPSPLTADNFRAGRNGAAHDEAHTTLDSLAHVNLKIATFNALTLNDYAKRGSQYPPQPSARTLHLERQWIKEECHIVGLQETRAYREQLVSLKSGFLILTPAKKGAGGCGLYVNTATAYGQTVDGPLHFARKHFTIVFADHETLAIKVRAPQFETLLVVAHAPSLDKGEEARFLFWKDLATRLDGYHVPVVLMADANDELQNGCDQTAFQWFLQEHHLITPACHHDFHIGSGWTHTSAKGGLRKRLDYVAVPDLWVETTRITSRVAYEADVAIHKDDHEMALLHIRRAGDGTQAQQFRVALPYTNPQFPCSYKHEFWRQRLVTALAAAQQVPDFQPHTSLDQHAMALHQTLLREAQQAYPVQKAKAKKPYVSQQALDLIQQRSTLRRLRNKAIQRVCHKNLDYIFQAWAKRRTHPRNKGTTYDHYLAVVTRDFDHTCYALRQQLHQDKKWFFETLAGTVPDGMEEKSLNQWWPLLKFALPKQACKPARTLPRDQMTREALQYFSKIEDGCRCTRDFLWEWHLRGLRATSGASTRELPLDFLPTLAEVEGVIASFKHYKSPGEDLLTADLIQAGGSIAAKWILPLVTKCFASGQLPLVFQGATLIPLYKGKGPADDLTSYRSIVLAPTIGKIVQALLRRRILPHVLPHFGPFQLGGKPKGQVAFCTQAVRAFLNIAKYQNRPAAVLFIDVKQAFYSLPRHHAVGPYLSAQDFEWLVQHLEQDQHDPNKRNGATRCRTPIPLQEVPEHLMLLLRNLVRHGWLVDQHADQCAFTFTGTRPGLPLADLLFNIAMIKVLNNVQGDLQCAGITIQIPGLQEGVSAAYPAVAWQDDVALVFDADSNESLRERMSQVVDIVLQRFEEAHMTINFAKGKTELIAIYRGAHATQYQRQDIVQEGGTIKLTERALPVQTVSRYQHLGSLLQGDAESDGEVWARIRMAQDALRMLRRGAFQVRGLSQACRVALLETLVFSRLFYNAATWVTIHRPAWKALQQFYHRAVRTAVRLPVKDAATESHARALRKAALPDVGTQLRLRRLQHLGHLARTAPHELLAVLDFEESITSSSWGALVTEDVQWLRQCGGSFAELAPKFAGTMALVPWIQAHSSYWKGWLRRGKQYAVTLHNVETDVNWFRKQMRLVLPECGMTFHAKFTSPQAHLPCPECGAAFADTAALASHRYMKHGTRSAHARYCSGTVCPVCLYECFSTDRLLWHMKQSSRNRPCLQWAQVNLLPEEVITRVPLPAPLQGHKRLRGHFVQGPLPPTIRERVESGYLGRYEALLPPETEGADDGGETQEEEQRPLHRCESLVDTPGKATWTGGHGN